MARIVVMTAVGAQAANMPAGKPASEADAKKKIDAVYGRLESGQDFATVAANYSEDPNTASNNGDMGFVRESQLKTDPAVYDAISKLKPGQFTAALPMYDQGHRIAAYAIYELIARDAAGQRELNDPRVRQTIHTELHERDKQLLQSAYIEVLQNQARVRNYLAEQVLRQGAQ